MQNFDAGRRKHYDLNREGVRQLTSLTLGPPPLGAISIGDLDTAANATYVVPGMGTTLQDSTRLLLAAANLRNAQSLFTTDDTAVVAWIGYETPGPIAGGDPSVLYDGKAHKGAPLLSAELEGYRASVGPDTKLNVVAHSYGTTMSSIAVSQSPDLGVNSYVALGSAGIPIDVPNAASLHADHVYAGTGDEWVAPVGASEVVGTTLTRSASAPSTSMWVLAAGTRASTLMIRCGTMTTRTETNGDTSMKARSHS